MKQFIVKFAFTKIDREKDVFGNYKDVSLEREYVATRIDWERGQISTFGIFDNELNYRTFWTKDVECEFKLVEEYKNTDKKCECHKCEISYLCNYKDRYQRLPRENAPGALGLCKKL